MRILTLQNSGRIYTSEVYLVLGDNSRIEDVNTLVDVGQDPTIFTDLGRAPTGVGKWAVEQVVLTHGHSDHCALLPRICERTTQRFWRFLPTSPKSMACCFAMAKPSAWGTRISKSSTHPVTAATPSAYTTGMKACCLPVTHRS